MLKIPWVVIAIITKKLDPRTGNFHVLGDGSPGFQNGQGTSTCFANPLVSVLSVPTCILVIPITMPSAVDLDMLTVTTLQFSGLLPQMYVFLLVTAAAI